MVFLVVLGGLLLTVLTVVGLVMLNELNDAIRQVSSMTGVLCLESSENNSLIKEVVTHVKPQDKVEVTTTNVVSIKKANKKKVSSKRRS